MGAADSIRKGKLEAHTGKDKAGLRPYVFVMVLITKMTPGNTLAGIKGLRAIQALTFSPRPQILMKRQEIPRQSGPNLISDCVLTGAFPTSLKGTLDGVPVTVPYPTPRSLLADIQKADHFLIDGEVYQFSASNENGGGSISVDQYQSEWTLKLVRSTKQSGVPS